VLAHDAHLSRKRRGEDGAPGFGGDGKNSRDGRLLLCGGGGRVGGEFGYAVDHVGYGVERSEGFVGDLDGEGLFDFEGDVDLVEGVDVELVEGAGERDGVGWDALRFGDDVDAAGGDVVHGRSTSSVSGQGTAMCGRM